MFADSLIESGESLKQMADLKYALDDNVKQVCSNSSGSSSNNNNIFVLLELPGTSSSPTDKRLERSSASQEKVAR